MIERQPEELLKTPYIFEFAGLKENKNYLETDLETIIELFESLLEELKKSNIEADMVTSNDNSELKKYIIENERFECKVLITTSVLDNGVNIKDDDVTNIIIDSFDKVTFIQEIGRIRIDIKNAKTIKL